MTIRSLFFITAAMISTTIQAISSEAAPTTVYLWPSKIAEFKDRPTEVVSPNDNGNVTRIGKVFSPSITIYQSASADTPAPAILVCPGGGYGALAIDKEGTEIAEWLNSKGITAIVLKYSVPKMRDEALRDIQRAMGIIRQNSKEWKIDETKLGVMGFSAGGNLATRLVETHQKRTYEAIDEADKLSCKPDYCILVYPAWLEASAVTESHPPTLIVQTKDDSFSKATIPYADALKAKKVPLEFHFFDVGGHGYGLRPSDNPVSKWPELCEKWIQPWIR